MTFSKFRLLSRASWVTALCCHCEVPDIFTLAGGTGQALAFVPNCGYILHHTSKLKKLGGGGGNTYSYALFHLYSSISLGVQEDGDSFPKTLATEIKQNIPSQ